MDTLLLDDKLEVIAEKTMTDGSGRKLNLADNWKNKTVYSRDDKGEVKIYSYWNGVKGKGIQYCRPEDRAEKGAENWIPCFEREVKTNIDNVHIKTRGNQFNIRVCKLSTSDKGRLLSSRYRTVVDILHSIRPEIINYTSRGGSEKAFLESSRNIIKRNFKLYEYEYNILITNKELGKSVFKELAEHCKNQISTTLYLKGYNNAGKKQGGTSVKIYDHGLKHEGIPDLYKLEITLRRAAFKKLNLNIADMTIQEVCINRLKAEVMTEMFKLKGGAAVQDLQLALYKEDNMLARFIRLEEKSADHDREISEIKKQLAEIRRAQ